MLCALSAFNLSAPVPGKTGTASSAINAWGALAAGGYANGTSNTDPKLFVTILIFDSEHNFKDVAYQQVSSSGALISASYTVKEPGYAYLYVSNEHPTFVDAFFDDVKMTLTPSVVIALNDYYSFGMTAWSAIRERSVSDYKFNGKEEQTELGLGWLDFGARMYDPTIARWYVVDPLAEKMRRFSPYVYAFDNPIRFIDPDGQAPSDVVLGGLDKEKALQQLNSGVKGITVTADKDGKLSYTKTEGEKLDKAANALVQAIDDHSIEVTINTTMKAENSEGGVLVGGAFMGNKVAEDGTVKATNEYDTPTGGRLDDAYNKPGGTILHEITEAYEGAKMSQESKQSSGPDGTEGSVYKAAHKAALNQPGDVIQTFYDAKGNVMPPGTPPHEVTGGVVWRAANGKFIHSLIIKK